MLTNAAGPFARCHAKVPATLIFENCVFDVCANNGDERVLQRVSRPHFNIFGEFCLLYFILFTSRPTVTCSMSYRYCDSYVTILIKFQLKSDS